MEQQTGVKKKVVVVPRWSNRDDDKAFLLTEMPARQAEKWAWRLFLAVKGTTAQVPPEVEAMGMVGVAIRGLNSFLAADVEFAKLEPLLDEMMQCVRIVRDPKFPDVTAELIEGDIMEVQTLMWLRSEVLNLHTGFSFYDIVSTWAAAWTRQSPPSPDLPIT